MVDFYTDLRMLIGPTSRCLRWFSISVGGSNPIAGKNKSTEIVIIHNNSGKHLEYSLKKRQL